MGHFSMKIMPLPRSLLGANQQIADFKRDLRPDDGKKIIRAAPLSKVNFSILLA
ncbi:MAG: hypothetical protein Q7J06_01565 [Bacteroidales bacterium]|nr:hypothetical protein [Bacteroidales bacterium]